MRVSFVAAAVAALLLLLLCVAVPVLGVGCPSGWRPLSDRPLYCCPNSYKSARGVPNYASTIVCRSCGWSGLQDGGVWADCENVGSTPCCASNVAATTWCEATGATGWNVKCNYSPSKEFDAPYDPISFGQLKTNAQWALPISCSGAAEIMCSRYAVPSAGSRKQETATADRVPCKCHRAVPSGAAVRAED